MASLFTKKRKPNVEKLSDTSSKKTETIVIDSGLYISDKCYYESFYAKKKVIRSNVMLGRLDTKPVLATHESRVIPFEARIKKIRIHLSETQFVWFSIDTEITTDLIIDMVKSAMLILLDSAMAADTSSINADIFKKMDQNQFLNTVVHSVNITMEQCKFNPQYEGKEYSLVIDCIKFK